MLKYIIDEVMKEMSRRGYGDHVSWECIYDEDDVSGQLILEVFGIDVETTWKATPEDFSLSFPAREKSKSAPRLEPKTFDQFDAEEVCDHLTTWTQSDATVLKSLLQDLGEAVQGMSDDIQAWSDKLQKKTEEMKAELSKPRKDLDNNSLQSVRVWAETQLMLLKAQNKAEKDKLNEEHAELALLQVTGDINSLQKLRIQQIRDQMDLWEAEDFPPLSTSTE